MKINLENFHLYFVGIIWSLGVLFNFVRAVFLRLPLVGEYGIWILYSIFVAIGVLALPTILKRITGRDILLVGCFYIIYLANYLIFPENEEALLFYAPFFLLVCIPLYFMGRTLDVARSLDFLYFISFLTIIFRIVYFMFFEQSMSDTQSLYEGDMGSAYNLLPHVCLVIYYSFKRKKIWDIIVSFMGIAFLSFLGSRGPILCMLLFVIFTLALFVHFQHKKIIFIILGSMVLLFLSPSILTPIFSTISDISASLGLSNRIFDKFLGGELYDPSNRNYIIDYLLELIFQQPILGYGIAADRHFIGVYAHNVLIEVWLEYGIILGSILLGIVFFIIFKAWKLAKNEYYRVFITLLTCTSVFKLFLSNTYLMEMHFFFLIGICVQILQQHRSEKLDEFN